MTITIRSPSTPTGEWSTEGSGRVAVFVPAVVEVSGARGGTRTRRDAIAIRWEGIPANARMSQRVSLRAFLLTNSAMTVPLHPRPPHTDAVISMLDCDDHTRVAAARFPLSPPLPAHRIWRVDALPDRDRRDTGRAFVTDESYSFSERQGRTIIFYDRPRLGLQNLPAALRAEGLSEATHPRCELIGLFHTELWRGAQRVGIVQWSRTWVYATSMLGALRTPTGRYEDPSFHTRTPPLTPTPTESRRMLFQWQREERRREICD